MNTVSNTQFQQFKSRLTEDLASYFSGDSPVACARAPGRLDVMGGVADYSGGTVLEGTIADATFAAAQCNNTGVAAVHSLSAENAGLSPYVEIPLDCIFVDGGCVREVDVRQMLSASSDKRWGTYVLGCLYMLVAEGVLAAERITGLRIAVDSSVPIGAGVSSSAALEVASMIALCGIFGVHLNSLEIARLCQTVENRIAGAPCGIMDQVTSAMGRENEFLVLKCQPHDVLGYVNTPVGCEFVGIDSGVKHSVAGGHYTRARIGAFMGLKILQSRGLISNMALALDRSRQRYLCNMSASEWADWKHFVPETLSGAEFLAKFGELTDGATTVDSHKVYSVRACTEHPILENDRVRQFISLLTMAGPEPDCMLLEECGHLMLDAHRSYSDRLDLGAEETDLLVELAMSYGPEKGVYGAKITGGGSGGTVALLCAGSQINESIAWITSEYKSKTGIDPAVMRGSSCGAVDFGVKWLNGE